MKDLVSLKFTQNEDLNNILLSTRDNMLGEDTRNKHWGTGIPLYHKFVFRHDKWEGNNKMGAILEEIRQELKS